MLEAAPSLLQKYVLFGCLILACLSLGPGTRVANAAPRELWPVPAEIASSHFTVTIDGKTTPVMHAAVNNYFLNFEASRHAKITVTADQDGFWSKGVEVQPWRLGIRPQVEGRTLRFELNGAAKITISRPGDYLSDAEMLYLFANEKEHSPPKATSAGVHFIAPGVHRESIDAVNGDTIYLAPGAVVFGALNVWQVHHVKVFGRGVIVYDGPQNPSSDDGWMHKRNWHCIVMDQASDITVDGITCVTRSRTWQVQMKDSHQITYNNVKIIGANAGNANADGMDWLGGGDTVVHDSFFRAADDIFAMQGSWEGYGPIAFAVQGSPVKNIKVDSSVLSTSISNVVRAAWPDKNFEGGSFTLRDSDVVHAGIGGCGIPFALMEVWADPHGRGKSGDYRFENLRLDHWYSLVQAMEPIEGVDGLQFTDIFAPGPPLAPSELRGKIHNVVVDNVNIAGATAAKSQDVPFMVTNGADLPKFTNSGPAASIKVDKSIVHAGDKLTFSADPESGTASAGSGDANLKYTWSFGDGSHAAGRVVKHRFADKDGTLRDGSGLFRVLLEISGPNDRHSWRYIPVVVTDMLAPALTERPTSTQSGVAYTYREASTAGLTAGSMAGPVSGVAPAFSLTFPHRDEDYSIEFSGLLDVPADGGYVLTLLSSDSGQLSVDGKIVATSPALFPQVCELKGNAVRPAEATLALAKGLHRITATNAHGKGIDGFKVYWQGPGMPLVEIPSSSLYH